MRPKCRVLVIGKGRWRKSKDYAHVFVLCIKVMLRPLLCIHVQAFTMHVRACICYVYILYYVYMYMPSAYMLCYAQIYMPLRLRSRSGPASLLPPPASCAHHPQVAPAWECRCSSSGVCAQMRKRQRNLYCVMGHSMCTLAYRTLS